MRVGFCESCVRGDLRFSKAPKNASLVVFGATAVDITARVTPSSTSALIAHSTVPGKVTSTLGGVARNMAEAAHRSLPPLQSTSTLLVSPLGDDSFGSLVRHETAAMNMRTDGFFSPRDDKYKSTPVCNMILGADGDLFGGVADFTALEALTLNEV